LIGVGAALVSTTSLNSASAIIEKDVQIGGAFGQDGDATVITVSRRVDPSVARIAEFRPETPAEIASLGPIEGPAALQIIEPPLAPDAYIDLSKTDPAALTIGATPGEESAVEDESQTEEASEAEATSMNDADSSAAGVELQLREVEIERGDTMITALMRGGLEYAEAHSAAKAVAGDFNPRRMQIGDVLTLGFKGDSSDEGGNFLGLAIRHKGEAELAAQWRAQESESESFEAAIDASLAELRTLEDLEPKREPKAAGPVLVSTEIDSSLYQSAVAAGMTPSQVSQLTRLFGFRVDFQRSVRKGDLMEAYFERVEDANGDVEDGPILFARLTNQGRDLAYYRQPEKDGGGYFDAKGESNKRSLMLTPIDGARITSGFGQRRHPILGYTKMHKGIDFGARSGTPIYAAGDGVIEEIGWHGGYGRYVRIRHNGV